MTAVLENIHSLHHSRSGEINLDPVTILSPLCEPSTVIWIVTTVYSPVTWCKLVTGCTSAAIYIQCNIYISPCEENRNIIQIQEFTVLCQVIWKLLYFLSRFFDVKSGKPPMQNIRTFSCTMLDR